MNKTQLCAVAFVALHGQTVFAADHPQLKEGLWQVHMQFFDAQGKPTTELTEQICRNHAYDQAAEDKARTVLAKNCASSENYSEDKLTSELSCKVKGSTQVTKGVTTFLSDSATHAESHTSYTPPLGGSTGESMVQDQKFLGNCPSDMQIGDRKRADGVIIHSKIMKP